MEGLVVCGGEAPPERLLAELAHSHDLVCAADSGLDALSRIGIRPDYVVGDMDSLSDERLLDGFRADQVERASREKDDTDTELAIRLLRGKGCTTIRIAGGGGGRLDHLVAILSLFSRENAPDEWITASERITLVRDAFRASTVAGELVSVFPVDGEASGMRSNGLRWPLDGLVWKRGDFGLSNVATAEEVEIFAGKGRLVVIRGIRRP